MKYKVFQINTDRDAERVKFLSYGCTMRKAGKINMEIYDEVARGMIQRPKESPQQTLEVIYGELNRIRDHRPGFKGHFLSVSDVVELDGVRWFCDSVGWRMIS
jgi:hypothetical protein